VSKMLHIEIVNPAGKVYEGQAAMLIARATNGEFGVLPGHAPMLALLTEREVRILTEEGEQQILVQGGILQVELDSEVTILTSR
jgi:F-type H+-transporting ATPase subunit epsilon